MTDPDLRPILKHLAERRAYHVERAKRYADAEQALLRVLDMDANASERPAEAHQPPTASAGRSLPPEATSSADGHQAGTAKCRTCAKTFRPRRGGKAQRYCSSQCRVAASRRGAREPNGELAEPEPVQDWPRPFMAGTEDTSDADALRVPPMPWDAG